MLKMKRFFVAVLLAAAIVSSVEAQVQVGIHIPFLNFGGFARPETVVAVYFKQVDGSVVWLDLNARFAAVVEPNTTFRLSWQESRISWLLDGGYGYGYGYGWRSYARQVRFTANVCPAESVFRQETTQKVKGKEVTVTNYGCTAQKFTFSSGDFVVSDPQYFPQQVSIIYFCGAWSTGYWLSDKGCPVTMSAAATQTLTPSPNTETPRQQGQATASPYPAAPAPAIPQVSSSSEGGWIPKIPGLQFRTGKEIPFVPETQPVKLGFSPEVWANAQKQ
jgi:hypothetical protein